MPKDAALFAPPPGAVDGGRLRRDVRPLAEVVRERRANNHHDFLA